MSSVVIWEDRATAVRVSWNKEGPHTVHVPLSIDADGICDGRITEWPGEEAAIQAGKEAAKQRLEEMRKEDPSTKRFRILDDPQGTSVPPPDTHNREWFVKQGFDQPAIDELDSMPVSGTCRATYGSLVVVVQRVE